MLFEKASVYFLPPALKNNPLHPDYEEKVTAINTIYIVFLFMCVATVILYLNGYYYPYFFYQGLINLTILPLYKKNRQMWGHFITNCITYPMWYYFFARTGGIYSVNINYLYPFILAAISAVNVKMAPVNVIIPIIVLYFLYIATPESAELGSKLYAFISHSLFLFLTAAIMIVFIKQKNKLVAENKKFQNSKIDIVNEEVSRRTKELSKMRQTLAADFHDETGNMLSAISRQAAVLKIKLKENEDLLSSVDHIISNSNQLYASSRHFIWNLNNDSDDPQILFNYLTSFGQLFYNGFDISFSAENGVTDTSLRLEPFAAINLIFIFKEAMNNVVKHAEAKDVVLKIAQQEEEIVFFLTDDGTWKKKDTKDGHYGLMNIEKRCAQNNFRFAVNHINGIGTRIEVAAPVTHKQSDEPIAV